MRGGVFECLTLIVGGGDYPLVANDHRADRHLVDIGRLPDLDYIREESGVLRLGALTRHVQVVESSLVQEKLPLMSEVAGVIGDVQVRNVGTVAGSMAEADPAGDWGVALLALNGRLLCQSSQGQRWLGAQEFFVDAYTTALGPDELITAIDVPAQDAAATGAYVKLARRVGDAGVATVAVQVRWAGDGTCASAAVAVGAAASVPFRASEAEAFLAGRTLDEAAAAEAARLVQAALTPFSDVRGSAEYRRDMVAVALTRALGIASRRHAGERVEAGYA